VTKELRSALWMDKQSNDHAKKTPTIKERVKGGDKIAKQVTQCTQIVLHGWLEELDGLILTYKLNLEPNHKMLNYYVHVLELLSL
jgi:hypothetical protein